MNALLKTIADWSTGPVCVVSPELSIVFSNRQFLRVFGIPVRSTKKKELYKTFFTTNVSPKTLLSLKKLLSQNKPISNKKCIIQTYANTNLTLRINMLPGSSIDKRAPEILLFLTPDTPAFPDNDAVKTFGLTDKKETARIARQNILLTAENKLKTKELKKMRQELDRINFSLTDELELAKDVQSGLLPHELPHVGNLEIAGAYLPTEKVGGDMYDIIPIADGKIAVLIFDVSGHGVPSALICAMAKMLFTQYIKPNALPSQIFTEVNKEICKYLRTSHYLTAFLGIIDARHNSMVYSQAGHVYPLLYHHQTESVTFIPGNSTFLGHSALSEMAQYYDSTISLEWNDKLFLHTDGLTESLNTKDEFYGTTRLTDLLKKHGRSKPEQLIKTITDHNAVFRGGMNLADDVTICCIQFGCSDDLLAQAGFSIKDQPNVLILKTFDEIENTCSVILHELDKKGYSNTEIFQTHQCIHELLANAIQHGNQCDEKKKVTVIYVLGLDCLSVGVIDEGKGFNHRKIMEDLVKSDAKRSIGKGLYIVKNYMDSVEFNSTGTVVIIKKNHRPKKDYGNNAL